MRKLIALLNKLRETRSPVFTEIGIKPGVAVKLRDFESTFGSFRIWLDLHNVHSGDEFLLKVYIRPAPGSELLLFESTSIKDTPEELVGFSVGSCSGFQLELQMVSGRPLTIPISVYPL